MAHLHIPGRPGDADIPPSDPPQVEPPVGPDVLTPEDPRVRPGPGVPEVQPGSQPIEVPPTLPVEGS